MRHFFFLAFCTMLFGACSNNKQSPKLFWLDNPTDAAIMVTIDDQMHEIPATLGMAVELAAGKHRLTYNHESVWFVVKPNDQDVVLNPTLSNYVFHHEMYQVAEKRHNESEREKIEKTYLYDLQIDSSVVKVPFKMVNSLFIEKYEYYWHFGVTQPYPEQTSINYNGPLSSIVRSKLFREKDFFNYIGKDQLPAGFAFPSNTQKLSELEPFVLIDETMICDCKPANVLLDQMRAKFDSMSIVTDPVVFLQLKEAVTIYLPNGAFADIAKECRPSYNKNIGANNYDSIYLAMRDRVTLLSIKNAYVVR